MTRRVLNVEALGSLQLSDSTGTPRKLGEFWAERPVVLAFARHFG